VFLKNEKKKLDAANNAQNYLLHFWNLFLKVTSEI